MKNIKANPWAWVPTLYFAEGVPYFLVNTISTIMFKRLGMSNADIAVYTSLLYLPWVIKPFWSPFVDILKTKRWWILSMQIVMAAAFAILALTLPSSTGGSFSVFWFTLLMFYLSAFASATHDIAADGFYMLALSEKQQSFFVGIRSTFYRLSSIFGQGVLVVLAGVLETRLGDIPKAWSITVCCSSAILLLIALYHLFILPKPADDSLRENLLSADTFATKASGILREFVRTFKTFFSRKGIVLAMVFLLLYRLPEAFLVKMLNPFLLDNTASAGGLGLSVEDVGWIYGTMGILGLTIGGILGGMMASAKGLKRSLWPMALAMTLPDLVYVYFALALPTSKVLICSLIALEQFGYGFGFTAYMLYMIYISEGEFKTSHYSLCTAFMALSMMIPGFFAGFLQESLGYAGFFIMVMACCLITVGVTFAIGRGIDPSFGKK